MKNNEAKNRLDCEFLSSLSPEYFEMLLNQYFEDPSLLDNTTRAFFDGIRWGVEESVTGALAGQKSSGIAEFLREQKSDQTGHARTNGTAGKAAAKAPAHKTTGTQTKAGKENLSREAQVAQLIEAYRGRGHLKAKLDPLDFHDPTQSTEIDVCEPDLELSKFKLDSVANDDKFAIAQNISFNTSQNLKTIVDRLEKTYCGSIGVEYLHIADYRVRRWLEEAMEGSENATAFTKEQRKNFYDDVMRAGVFENFLQKNFTGQKRFSMEGAESVVVALKELIRYAGSQKTKEVIIGMAHRGRLNVLAHVMNKPYDELFNEFKGALFGDKEMTGDVKYHLGRSSDLKVDGKDVHISLAFNPSHLEAVDPVLMGMARAKQEGRYNQSLDALLPIMIHGDAAVCGQGVVWETLNMSNLEGYKTGGTIHFIINNQIGFTTMPKDSRSSRYCTDFTKAIAAPIFHVNGDDVEALAHVTLLAAKFRETFHRDIFIDVICYRKYGHNEGDEPRFTQPTMYQKISKHPAVYKIYSEKLEGHGVLAKNEGKQRSNDFEDNLDGILENVRKTEKAVELSSLKADWSVIKKAGIEDMLNPGNTTISKGDFKKIIEAIHHIPDTVKPLPKFMRSLQKRLERIEKEDEIDWAVAEQLAFGSLLIDGHSIRLSGQDCQRGTFGHRHSVLHDAQTNEVYRPLDQFAAEKHEYQIHNSPLSEYAVMGFDFGYSISNPMALTMWEAQFGDFSNGAQIIIDQFLSSSEAKWLRMSGLTLLLPHGHEGQGPEHSSARLERYLQLGSRGNIQVVYPTMPSQYFHLLRRQLKRPFRKPLIVMTPKGPLRKPQVVSTQKDFTEGHFHNILVTKAAKKAERVILCAGKVYWDLLERATELKIQDKITLVRVEQLYPLDHKALQKLCKDHSHVKEWVWAQEEPENMGAWYHFFMSTKAYMPHLRYAGRASSPSVATGSPSVHQRELEELLKSALVEKNKAK